MPFYADGLPDFDVEKGWCTDWGRPGATPPVSGGEGGSCLYAVLQSDIVRLYGCPPCSGGSDVPRSLGFLAPAKTVPLHSWMPNHGPPSGPTLERLYA